MDTERDFHKRSVEFRSRGEPCAASFYVPLKARAPHPCVVMANGFSGTKDWILPDFAAHFASRGIAVLTFDYRRLGESGGTPRQVIDTDEQFADLEAAIHFAKNKSDVDPHALGLWGTSLGGNYVIRYLGNTDVIATAVLNAPALDAVRGANLKKKSKAAGAGLLAVLGATARLFILAVYDRLRATLGASPCYVKVYGDPGRAFFTDPALQPLFDRLERENTRWKNQVGARFLLKPPRYQEGTMQRIRIPLLFCLAERDLEISNDYVKAKASLTPQATVKTYPAAHFDLYHRPTLDNVLADQFEFLSRHLGRSPG
ncbi:alpha/beta hydrolase [Peristeroidobacter agariperforans]|uniref:alpha/beta hydrolase n=1 Tax=Peristeroidobacter agariperforans TaxID=268404 RepID=UPI00101C1D8A|nr:alpha/beta fold hydrolase [Peristeroidobacter agariperforans]